MLQRHISYSFSEWGWWGMVVEEVNLLEICNSPATQGLRQGPTCVRLLTPYHFRLGTRGLVPLPTFKYCLRGFSRDQIGGHTDSCPLSRRWLLQADLPAQTNYYPGCTASICNDPQLAFKDFPTKMGRILSLRSVTLTIAWNQTLSTAVTS